MVAEVLPCDTYLVINLRNKGRSFITTAHVSQLKTWCKSKEEDHIDENSKEDQNDEDSKEEE